MPFSPEIDSQIRKRFEELETEARRLVDLMEDRKPILGRARSEYSSAYFKLRTNFLNLIQMLSARKNSFIDLIKDVRSANERTPAQIHGMISGLKSDYEAEMLLSIAEMIETNVVADYLTQAERLFKGDKKGVHTYGPSAVLAGAVLEDGLRRLCSRQSPPIGTNKSGGYPKTMGTLIDSLKNAGLFNELKAKQLRAWADIRNAAAHGRFNDFTRTDIEQMIPAIQNFLADYL